MSFLSTACLSVLMLFSFILIDEFILSIRLPISCPFSLSLKICSSRALLFSVFSWFSLFTFSSFSSVCLIWSSTMDMFLSASSILALESFMVSTKSPTSMSLNSYLRVRYFLAFSACFSRGPICLSNSPRMSFILTRFCSVLLSFLSLSSFRILYFMIPEASSNMPLLSLDLLFRISSTLPCPIIEKPSLPIPVSANKS